MWLHGESCRDSHHCSFVTPLLGQSTDGHHHASDKPFPHMAILKLHWPRKVGHAPPNTQIAAVSLLPDSWSRPAPFRDCALRTGNGPQLVQHTYFGRGIWFQTTTANMSCSISWANHGALWANTNVSCLAVICDFSGNPRTQN